MQITPQIHMIHGMANQYLIIDHAELTLIDTGMASNKNTIINFIKSLGFQPDNLKRILITHSDIDHYGAANSLREITGAKVYASRIEATALETGIPSREIHPKGLMAVIFKIFGAFITPVITSIDFILEPEEVLPILGGLHILSSSGHTPDHVSFFLPAERILFAGDSINSSHGKPVPNLSALTGDPDEAQKSFDSLMKLDPQVLCCGHTYIDLRGS